MNYLPRAILSNEYKHWRAVHHCAITKRGRFCFLNRFLDRWKKVIDRRNDAATWKVKRSAIIL